MSITTRHNPAVQDERARLKVLRDKIVADIAWREEASVMRAVRAAQELVARKAATQRRVDAYRMAGGMA